MAKKSGWGCLKGLAFLLTGLVWSGGAEAQSYAGPQAVVYIGDNWCYGGYCSGGTAAAFEAALNQSLMGSGYVLAVRKPDSATLNMRAGITGSSGNGGGLCLPVIGCVNARKTTGTIELSDIKSGVVIYRDNCEGTSAGFSTWTSWTGSVNFNSDDDKAAADCAGKLVQKLTTSNALKPYLVQPLGSVPVAQSAPAPVQQVTSTVSTSTVSASTAQSTGAAQAVNVVKMLEGQLKGLAFADMNSMFTSDPYNPVKLKELNAAANSASLAAAAKVKFSVTAGENAGAYQLVGVSYTLPNGQEKFVQLAVTSDPNLNTRGGTKILYLSAFNPMRGGNTALDGVSKNVETLLNDLSAALGLPKL